MKNLRAFIFGSGIGRRADSRFILSCAALERSGTDYDWFLHAERRAMTLFILTVLDQMRIT